LRYEEGGRKRWEGGRGRGVNRLAYEYHQLYLVGWLVGRWLEETNNN